MAEMDPLNRPDRDSATEIDSVAGSRPAAILLFAEPGILQARRKHWPVRSTGLLGRSAIHEQLGEKADIHIFSPVPLQRKHGESVHLQEGRTFGDRLNNAVETLLQLGYERIVIVGSDCPDLDSQDLLTALESLESRSVVLGPDHRGGLYLIGISKEQASLLHGISWCCDSDYAQLRQRVPREELVLLPVKQDLDTILDIRHLGLSGSKLSPLAASLLLSRRRRSEELQDACSTTLGSRRRRLTWQMPPPVPFL